MSDGREVASMNGRCREQADQRCAMLMIPFVCTTLSDGRGQSHPINKPRENAALDTPLVKPIEFLSPAKPGSQLEDGIVEQNTEKGVRERFDDTLARDDVWEGSRTLP